MIPACRPVGFSPCGAISAALGPFRPMEGMVLPEGPARIAPLEAAVKEEVLDTWVLSHLGVHCLLM